MANCLHLLTGIFTVLFFILIFQDDNDSVLAAIICLVLAFVCLFAAEAVEPADALITAAKCVAEEFEVVDYEDVEISNDICVERDSNSTLVTNCIWRKANFRVVVKDMVHEGVIEYDLNSCGPITPFVTSQ